MRTSIKQNQYKRGKRPIPRENRDNILSIVKRCCKEENKGR